MDITVKMAANFMVKVGIRGARKKIAREWPHTPKWLLEGYVRTAFNRLTPKKYANVIYNSEYTTDQVVTKLFQ